MSHKPSKKLHTTADCLLLLQDIANNRQEHLICLSINSGRQLIAKRLVFIGTIDAVMVHPREVFSGAVADLAAGIIVAHNHPSGDPTPSKQDIAATQQLVAAGQILGIRLYDHIIVTDSEHYSFSASGLMLD